MLAGLGYLVIPKNGQSQFDYFLNLGLFENLLVFKASLLASIKKLIWIMFDVFGTMTLMKEILIDNH